MKNIYRRVDLTIRTNESGHYVVDHVVDGQLCTTYTMYTLLNARDWAKTISAMETQYNKRTVVGTTEKT